MGIVKTIEPVKTRIHLNFLVFNNSDRPRAVKYLTLRINNGTAFFKQFFKIIEGGSRVPDPSFQFPKIINTKGVSDFEVEFENIEKVLIKKDLNKAEILVTIDDGSVISKDFTFLVDDAMENTLAQVDNIAHNLNQAQVFNITIKHDN